MNDKAWSLWVDDQSFDPNAPNHHPPKHDWVVVASSAQEAILLIDELGAPFFIDLDEDLGDGHQGSIKVVKHLYTKYPEVEILYKIRYPSSPVGNWLYSFMHSWHQILKAFT